MRWKLEALAARWIVLTSLTGGLLLTAGCGEDAPAPYHVRSNAADAATTDMRPGPSGEDKDGSAEPSSDAGSAGAPAMTSPEGCDDGPELRVLFIGNSHTYTNDLPALVRELACAAGTKLIAQSATPGGVGFVEHAVDPNTLAAIDAEPWDFVIMQDQQQRPGFRLEEVESDHVPAARSLVEAITASRAETRSLLFMVWPRRDGDTENCAYYPPLCSFEGNTVAVSQGYRLHAERTGAAVSPVALAWAAVHADSASPVPPAELWNPDGSHPNPTGSYLAASVLVGTLLSAPTAPLGFEAGLPPDVAAYLREVADRVVGDEQADPRVTTEERVRIACEYGAACSDAADAAAVTFTLSTDDCAELAAGQAEVRARIHTTLSCRGSCTTVPLADFHELAAEGLEDGAYQVHAQVDVNANRELDSGDLEACDSGTFVVGGGAELVFTELDVR